MITINCNARATLGVSVKTRNDYADYDYLHKLNEKDLKWLKGFHREYVNADFKHQQTKIFKRKDRKLIYNLNNIRNRCLYNIIKSKGMLLMASNGPNENKNNCTINLEDNLNDLIDSV